ncbi:MAG TPA: TraB/GumN family protein [Puia sp.]|nr:TraB/GumN family protein [Puia sp.]
MRPIFVRKLLLVLVCFLVPAAFLKAQKRVEKKYPTLLWEITGNGLQKTSYLFGTMHVSSKMVFHLSDSFYLDIKNSDVVALELDPQLWQDQLFRFESMQNNLRFYTQGSPGDYLNERSFQLEKYEDQLRSALSEEPSIINGLLYRSMRARADFEEDTYLDLYIYQTGKKLGKQATGVENYFQTEQLIMEAAQDMMKDKKKKRPDTDGQSLFEIEKKTQEAYRKGDLDMLDSLEKLMQPSDAYMEKFLYRRNEIQANSIDSIVKKHSLFVGVGAAHLPGRRGVIELLRKKGYILRPVVMQDREATRKDTIDKIRVPVSFSSFTSGDSAFTVKLPGKLYRRTDGHSADAWQYADMGNGAYYMIGRVKTHGDFLGQNEATILRKVDSLLYENIPGKILTKTAIVKNGFKGYDITTRTRRGDIQRYNILVTPVEVLVFKMSGNGNYAEGKEAEQFFGSIGLRNIAPPGWAAFTPSQGGFRLNMPRQPYENKNTGNTDDMLRWEYEADDEATGDGYLVWKKSVQNYRFLEEDTADLALMEESFRLSDLIDKQLSRRTGLYRGYPCLDAVYQQKDGSYIHTRCLIRGPHYYLLAARSRTRDRSFAAYFDSFEFAPYRYTGFRNYTDSFMNIVVSTPVVPDIDAGMRTIMEKASSEEFLNSLPNFSSYWPHAKTALFRDDSTGEAVFVSMETFPKYFYPKDTAIFWREQANEKKIEKDLLIRRKEFFRFNDSVMGYKYQFSDTNTSRLINNWIFLKDNHLFRLISLGDTLSSGSEFIGRFYSSLRPLDKRLGAPVFPPKLDLFFHDFYSRDSSISKKAREAIPNVYFGAAGVPGLLRAIGSLAHQDKDYYNTRTKLINELGYISDSGSAEMVVAGLKDIYGKAGDTSTFQNAVLKALAHLKTRPAYDALKVLLVQDPPVFDNPSDYNYLFQDLGDSLALARSLFPELLQLAAVDDYKENIRSLLTGLVDSGYLKASDYESHFSQIWFDAKIQWKKQEGRDEKKWQKKDDDKDEDIQAASSVTEDPGEMSNNDLGEYAILLIPFYEKNASVPHFFDRLLQSKDLSVRMSAVLLLLRNNRPVADSVIYSIAVSDQYRSLLLRNLESIHQERRFPAQFHDQLNIARSRLVSSRPGNDLLEVVFVDKKTLQFKREKGWLYLFKYRQNKEDEWQIGFSGLQPSDLKETRAGGSNDFVLLTDKKIKPDMPVSEQFDKQLRHFLFSKVRSAQSFYLDNDNFSGREEEE